MATRNEEDTREWIVEYVPAGESGFVPVADFVQSEGRAAHRLAMDRAKKKAEGELADRWYALEQEKERVNREVAAYLHERVSFVQRIKSREAVHGAELGSVTLEEATKEMVKRLKRRGRGQLRARNAKTGEVVPGEALGL